MWDCGGDIPFKAPHLPWFCLPGGLVSMAFLLLHDLILLMALICHLKAHGNTFISLDLLVLQL